MARRLVHIYDTTLRDGEQMPGVAFSLDQRLRIAKALDEAGIDEMEIGFAASGPEQRKDMKAIVDLGLRARLLSLARPVKGDIEATLASGVGGIIIFASPSPIHLKHKLQRSYEEVYERTRQEIRRAADTKLFVHFTIEDATRTPIERLQHMAKMAVENGAERLSLADTVGIATPEKMAEVSRAVLEVADVPLAVHCHDDFGLAVANCLAAVEAGASYVSTTVNGIGERSGNTQMERCVIALEKLYDFRTHIDLTKLPALSRMVEEYSGVPVPPNFPLVGANSFRHEAGIHVSALLRDPRCYEAFDPADIGRRRHLVIGKTSGRAAIRHLAGSRGQQLDDDACRRILDRIKTITESRENLDQGVLDELIEEEISSCPTHS